MTNFRSSFFPRSSNRLLISQEYAMQYYAGLNMIIMLGILVKVISAGMGIGSGMILAIVLAELAAVGIGNLMAYAKMRRNIAEILFINDHFSLISVYEVLDENKPKAFPMIYANASMISEDTISLHFNDQVVNLKRENWEEFDLLCEYLFAPQY